MVVSIQTKKVSMTVKKQKTMSTRTTPRAMPEAMLSSNTAARKASQVPM